MTRLHARPKFTSDFAPVLLVSGLLVSGCNKSSAPPPQAAPAPSFQSQAAPAPAPGTQPTMASAPPGTQTAVQPAGSAPAQGAAPGTVPATPAGSATTGPTATPTGSTPGVPATSVARRAAATPAPAPSLVVPAGTRVTIRTNETLSTKQVDVGQSFTGSLNYPITVRGTTAIPRGTSVRGTITSAKGRGRFKGAGVLGITLEEIGRYRVETTEYVASEKGRGKRTAGFIGGGGGAGALIGGLAGGGKGALLGGLLGAGGGTAAGALTGNRDVVIPAESAISFTTRSSIRIR